MKKLSLIAIFALISMLFFVSCDSDDEDTTDTATGDTTADTTADTQSDTDADTTDSAADTATDTDADTTDSTADTTADTDADTTADTDADTNADTTADTDADTTSDTATDTDTDTGSDTDADTMADTGSEGSDNLNTGDTSGNQAQSGKVGAACTSDSQCSQTYGSGDDGQEAFCLTQSGDGFPGGYCSFMCDMTDHAACDNAGGVYHANSQGSWGDGYCYHKCTKPSDCRTGYRCSNKIHACLPDCEVNECVYNTVCDETDKVCL